MAEKLIKYSDIKHQFTFDLGKKELVQNKLATASGTRPPRPTGDYYKYITKTEYDSLIAPYPQFANNGVHILSTDGELYNPDNWTSGETNAVGVAVVTDKCKFVIAPDEVYGIQWGGYGTLISGIITTTDQTTALTDYDGETNTKVIVDTLGATASLFEGIPILEFADLYNTQAQEGYFRLNHNKPRLKAVHSKVVAQFHLLM